MQLILFFNPMHRAFD